MSIEGGPFLQSLEAGRAHEAELSPPSKRNIKQQNPLEIRFRVFPEFSGSRSHGVAQVEEILVPRSSTSVFLSRGGRLASALACNRE